MKRWFVRPDPEILNGGETQENWRFVGILNVSGGSIWFGDLYVVDGTDGFLGRLVNGSFVIEVRLVEGTVCGARLWASGTDTLIRMTQKGEITTDQAIAALCDIKSLDAAVDGADDDFQNYIEELHLKKYGEIKFKMKSDIHLIYFSSATSDGVFPVFELVSDGERVGYEVVFDS